MEEKQVKLMEKSKQDEAMLTEMKAGSKPACPVSSATSSSGVTFTNPPLTQSYQASKPAENSVNPTTAIPTVIPTPVHVPTAAENKVSHPEITQEHILKEIQVTLEERKKLQTYVSKYEKGIQDLEKGTSSLHNVRITISQFRSIQIQIFYLATLIVTLFAKRCIKIGGLDRPESPLLISCKSSAEGP